MKNQQSSIWILLLTTLICVQCTTNKGVTKANFAQEINRTANWQITNFKYDTEGSPGYLHDYGIDAWTNSTFLLGLSVWADAIKSSQPAESATFYQWLNDIGSKNEWQVPTNFKAYPNYSLYHADELCITQFYLNMYKQHQSPYMIDAAKERIDWIVGNEPDTTMLYHNKQTWTWCDALFMAPAAYLEFYLLSNDDKYINFMHREFQRTYQHLYNKEYKLFYRDSSYFNKQEANGKPVFWGRGNGWVAAALVNLLKELPKDANIRPFYVGLYKEFIPTLANLMDEQGYWHASLLDPESYPSPEASASALITYAIAYGINEQLLDKSIYTPILKKAWQTLQSFVDANGKLGWIQPIGADPKQVTKDMTSVYGVGAYLLAASEIIKLK